MYTILISDILSHSYVLNKKQSLILYSSCYMVSILIALFYDSFRFRVKFGNKKIDTIFNLICCMIISLPVANVLGYRGTSTGYDTANYVMNYLNYGKENFSWSKMLATDPGYYAITKISYILWNGNKHGGLWLMTFLTIWFVAISLSKVRGKGALPIGLFTFYMIFGLNMGDQSRQLLSLSIMMLGIDKLLNGQTKRFIFYVIIATTVHLSSILSLVLLLLNYFDKIENNYLKIHINNIKIKLSYIFLILSSLGLLAIMLFSISIIYRYIPSHYKYVLDAAITQGHLGLKWVLDTMPIIIMMILSNWWAKSKKIVDRGPWYTIVFRISGYSSYFLMRIMYIPYYVGIFTVSNNFTKINNKNYKMLFCLISIVLLIAYFYLDNFILDEHNMMNYSILCG